MSNYNGGKFYKEKVKAAMTRRNGGHVLIGMARVGSVRTEQVGWDLPQRTQQAALGGRQGPARQCMEQPGFQCLN